MPRRRSRYSALFKELRASNGTPGANSNAAKFLKYLTGERKLTKANKIPGEYLERRKVGVLPFAVTPTGNTNDQYYETTMTRYSYAGLKKASLPIERYGIKFYTNEMKEENNFYPALIKPSFTSTVGSNANKTSAVTGDNYNYKRTRTFSIPFGRTTEQVKDSKSDAVETVIANVDEFDVLKSLRTALKATSVGADIVSISYEPELLKIAREVKEGKAETDFAPDDIPLS